MKNHTNRNKKIHTILKSFFDKKRAKNTYFTLRGFAKKLGVSPSFASRILSGKQDLPIERLNQIAEILEIDSVNITLIKKNLLMDYLKIIQLSPSEYKELFSTTQLPVENYKEITVPEKQFNVFDPWYNAALLDFSTCHNFRLDFKWLEKQLKVPADELQKSWNFLLEQGYIKSTETGHYEKTDKHLRLSSTLSIPTLRRFHKNVINKSLEELNNKVEQRHFERRLITSATVAVSPEKIEEAKKKIMNFMMELSLFCSQDSQCQDVYALGCLFFPLSQGESS